MRALTATELLDAWERGVGQSMTSRMLGLLAAACPESSREQLARLTIGERDRRLLQQREWLFGSKLETVTSCPRCSEQLESVLHVSEMLAQPARGSGGDSPDVMEFGGYRVTFRVPTSDDLLSLPANGEPASEQKLRAHLLSRCVVDARDADDASIAAETLPDDVIAALSRQMAVSDPHAAIELALRCPACAHDWRALFDISHFLWAEVCSWAQLVLREVHCLARAYGWREADVLALSPTRRSIYLELSRQ